MGQKFRSGRGPDEAMLMPTDPREWLPPGHLAWRVLELAGEMDLSRFGGYRADGQGGRPYHPVMMATLLLYCYCRGRKSSREIEMATFDDVGARVICGGLHPDHSTVAEFVRRNADAVLALLPEPVRACAREGLADLALVAGDGTKLKASASMAGNLTREQLDAQIAELQALIDGELRAWVQDLLDAEAITPPAGDDPGDGGDGGPGDGGPGDGKRKWKKKPARAGQVLERRLAARARLDALQDKDQGRHDARIAELAARIGRKEAAARKWEEAAAARIEARARKAAAGQRPRGKDPVPVDEDREVTRARQALADARADHAAALAGTAGTGPRPDGRRKPGRPARDKPAGARQASEAGQEAKASPADPSSRVMPLKKGGYDQLFNVQALATAKAQVILAITRHDSPVDVQALLPLLEEARRVLRAARVPGQIGKALFDTGYASDANFTAAIPETLYVAVTREARQTGRSQDGRAPEAMLPSWQDMTARLDTPEGRQLYLQRSATIEPVFAQLTARLGRTLHYRGSLVDAELALWAASHNILKAITARGKRLARQARTAATATPAPAAA
jgi:transposase